MKKSRNHRFCTICKAILDKESRKQLYRKKQKIKGDRKIMEIVEKLKMFDHSFRNSKDYLITPKTERQKKIHSEELERAKAEFFKKGGKVKKAKETTSLDLIGFCHRYEVLSDFEDFLDL